MGVSITATGFTGFLLLHLVKVFAEEFRPPETLLPKKDLLLLLVLGLNLALELARAPTLARDVVCICVCMFAVAMVNTIALV